MAQNPDPNLELASLGGATRTLDDWATVFHLAIVLLPPRPEAAQWVPVIDRIYSVLGDSDARTTVCVAAEELIVRRLIGNEEPRWLTFVDPQGRLAESLGLEALPAFVHLRQDTTLVRAAQGWSASSWQEVADSIADAHRWATPTVSHRTNPAPTPGWPL